MARRKRTRLATGIYADVYGITLRVHVRGEPRESDRFPLDTPLETLIRERKRFLREQEEAGATQARTHTLGAAVQAYLATLPKGRTRDDASTLLDHWKAAGFFGRSPDSLTAPEITAQLRTFTAMTKADGSRRFAPKTVKELRRLLGSVYITQNGKGGANPVRDTPAIVVRYDDPRGLDDDVVAFIFDRIPDRGRAEKGQERPEISETKLRLRVMVETGLHQVELMRLEEPDFRELNRQRLWVKGRKKGRGTEGGWHPLTLRGVKAIKAARAAGVLGRTFSTRSMSKTWNVAVGHARTDWSALHPTRPWPVAANVRPYDLRHTYGTNVYRASSDIRAAQKLLRNKTITVTQRYTLAAVDEQAQAASDALDRRHQSATTLSRSGSKTAQKPTPTPKSAVRGKVPRRKGKPRGNGRKAE